MRFKPFALAMVLFLVPFAFGQFGLEKLKKEVEEKPKSTTAAVEKPPDDNETHGSNSQSGAYMLEHTIMENFTLALRNGRLQIEKLRAMNLPATVANKNALMLTYKNEAGDSLASFVGMPLPPGRNPSWLMNYFRAKDDPSSNFKFDQPGNYTLDFSIDGQTFDTFEFSIAKHKNQDGTEWIVANGPWSNLAYITHNEKKPAPFKFSVWMRDFLEGTGERSSDWGKYKATIIRSADKKEIAVSNPGGRSRIAPLRYWKRYDLNFERSGSNGYYLETKDFTAQSGKYVIVFEHEGTVYGKYPFEVVDGKLKGIEAYNGGTLGSDGTVFWTIRED